LDVALVGSSGLPAPSTPAFRYGIAGWCSSIDSIRRCPSAHRRRKRDCPPRSKRSASQPAWKSR